MPWIAGDPHLENFSPRPFGWTRPPRYSHHHIHTNTHSLTLRPVPDLGLSCCTPQVNELKPCFSSLYPAAPFYLIPPPLPAPGLVLAPSVLSSLVTHPCRGSPVRKNPKMCVLSTPGQSRGTNGFCCQHRSEVALGLEQPQKHLPVWPLLFRITRYD